MYALPAADELTHQLDGIRIVVVTLATTATTQAIVAELRREAIAVDLSRLEVLDEAPRVAVYVVSLDTRTISAIAPRFVAWAATRDPRAGLIGLVENGVTLDCEELLAAGFDDATTTPVGSRELVARVRAVNRRVHWKGVSNGRIRFGDVTLDLYGRELWVEGKTISLTSIELAVLRELVKAHGKPLSRTDLLDLAWGEGELEVSERAVDNVISRLRRKLPRPELIETVRSVGFRLAPRANAPE